MAIDMFVNMNIVLEIHSQSINDKQYEKVIDIITDNIKNQQWQYIASINLYVDDSSDGVKLSMHLELDVDILKDLDKKDFPKYICNLMSDCMQGIEVDGLATYRVGVVEIFDHHDNNVTSTGVYADYLAFINGQWDGRGVVQVGSQLTDLSKCKVDALQEVARQLNIPYYNKKKDELIDCIYQCML